MNGSNHISQEAVERAAANAAQAAGDWSMKGWPRPLYLGTPLPKPKQGRQWRGPKPTKAPPPPPPAVKRVETGVVRKIRQMSLAPDAGDALAQVRAKFNSKLVA